MYFKRTEWCLFIRVQECFIRGTKQPDPALWLYPDEIQMNKIEFLFKYQCQSESFRTFFQGLLIYFAWNNHRIKEKNIQQKVELLSLIALRKGRDISLNVEIAQLCTSALPEWWGCYLDRKAYLELRGIQLFTIEWTLLLSEENTSNITTGCVSSFQILALQARTGVIDNWRDCQFCGLKATGLEGRRHLGPGTEQQKAHCGLGWFGLPSPDIP